MSESSKTVPRKRKPLHELPIFKKIDKCIVQLDNPDNKTSNFKSVSTNHKIIYDNNNTVNNKTILTSKIRAGEAQPGYSKTQSGPSGTQVIQTVTSETQPGPGVTYSRPSETHIVPTKTQRRPSVTITVSLESQPSTAVTQPRPSETQTNYSETQSGSSETQIRSSELHSVSQKTLAERKTELFGKQSIPLEQLLPTGTKLSGMGREFLVKNPSKTQRKFQVTQRLSSETQPVLRVAQSRTSETHLISSQRRPSVTETVNLESHPDTTGTRSRLSETQQRYSKTQSGSSETQSRSSEIHSLSQKTLAEIKTELYGKESISPELQELPSGTKLLDTESGFLLASPSETQRKPQVTQIVHSETQPCPRVTQSSLTNLIPAETQLRLSETQLRLSNAQARPLETQQRHSETSLGLLEAQSGPALSGSLSDYEWSIQFNNAYNEAKERIQSPFRGIIQETGLQQNTVSGHAIQSELHLEQTSTPEFVLEETEQDCDQINPPCENNYINHRNDVLVLPFKLYKEIFERSSSQSSDTSDSSELSLVAMYEELIPDHPSPTAPEFHLIN